MTSMRDLYDRLVEAVIVLEEKHGRRYADAIEDQWWAWVARKMGRGLALHV